jgi:cell division protein ZapA
MSQSQPVKVHILDREFLVACPEEERAGLLQSADLLDQRMREVRDGNKVMGVDRIAITAALNLTHELLQAREQAEANQDLAERLRGLNERLSACLDSGEDTDETR